MITLRSRGDLCERAGDLQGDLVDLEVQTAAEVDIAADRLRRIANSVETDGRHVRGRVRHAGREIPGLLRELDASGIALDSIEVLRPTLDDVFLTMTGRSLRDAQSGTENAALEELDNEGAIR